MQNQKILLCICLDILLGFLGIGFLGILLLAFPGILDLFGMILAFPGILGLSGILLGFLLVLLDILDYLDNLDRIAYLLAFLLNNFGIDFHLFVHIEIVDSTVDHRSTVVVGSMMDKKLPKRQQMPIKVSKRAFLSLLPRIEENEKGSKVR